ncbi:MAG: aminopeptidase P family protein [Rhodospirillaceae bacterium]|jgi:Xaa-Pro aminopeptidase|nr:aminopeptidase P family protein [Rhodospirillaceae bacterium]
MTIINKSGIAANIIFLRKELVRRGLYGFCIPYSDKYQKNYVPSSAFRLKWISGFSGSDGIAIVLLKRSALFVDGRYIQQASIEVDPELFEQINITEQSPHQWLAAVLPYGVNFGYDPWLHTLNNIKQLRQACNIVGAQLISCDINPIDTVWKDRPSFKEAPVIFHPINFSGRSSIKKRADLSNIMILNKFDVTILSAPESVAWLLNLRGGDVPFTPVLLSFAFMYKDGSVDLFIDSKKLTPETISYLGKTVHIIDPDNFGKSIDRLNDKCVYLDPNTTPFWIINRLIKARVHIEYGLDLCALPRACKNSIELDGMRHAHRRDGAVLVRFLAWLSETIENSEVTELSAAEMLDKYRVGGLYYQYPSFQTISATGSNSALPHYHVTELSNRPLVKGQLYLFDSGGQYLDGTTDVTRTIALGGAIGAEECRRFTQILNGHISLAMARFPKGTTGNQLDSLARQFLWADGLDYDHGTGHGVGSYLGVHEGPHCISKNSNIQALSPGMVVSNEPGYYKSGSYGIRIENLQIVCSWINQDDREYFKFEILTLVPIDLTLIDKSLLSATKIDWINSYHARIREELMPLLDTITAQWLILATQPI